MDIDDAGIQSLEIAVTEADELIEDGDESGARHLLLAQLAATRPRSTSNARGTCRRLQSPAARCQGEQQVVGR